MGVYIKGMKMPQNCGECPLETDYGACGYYSLFVEGGHDSCWEKRRDDCPLIELPDHGDLIDRDKTVKAIEALISARLEWKSAAREQISGLDAAICAVMDAKKVIPAERSESDE